MSLRRHRVLWLLGFVLFLGAVAEAAEGHNRVFTKCLFIGDSITMHGPSKSLDWHGNWGMAASSREKDFVHRLYKRICRAQPQCTPQLLISGRDTGAAGRIDNALKVLDELLAIKADLIVIQLGENEKGFEVTKDNLGAKYERLVKALKESGNPLILCTGVWSPGASEPRGAVLPKVTKNNIIRDVCAKYGCVFVDIGCVSHQKKNAARSEGRYKNSGVAWHPGDGGMKGYAEEIWAALQPYMMTIPIQPMSKLTGIVPEPQHVYTYTDRRNAFELSPSTVIVLREDAGALQAKAASLLKADIKKLYDYDVPVSRKELSGQKPALLLVHTIEETTTTWDNRLPILKELSGKGHESYQITCDENAIVIESIASAGVLYGAQTVRQMLRSDKTVPAVVIADWPDQTLRVAYGQMAGMGALIRKLARLKINMFITESRWCAGRNWWYNPTGNNLTEANQFFRQCREYNVEPVPLVQGLGWAYGVADLNPNCCEGLVSYNYMTYCKHQSPYCPSEPMTYDIVDRTLTKVVRRFRPRYLHIGHDEVIHKKRCSRCIQSGKSVEELMGEDIQHWYSVIKKLDPSITILMWDDLLRKNKYEGRILPFVPEDVIICPWVYWTSENSRTRMAGRMSWFLGQNNRHVLGTCSGYRHRNIWDWREAVQAYDTHPGNLGFMYTYWGESPALWSAVAHAAEYMWSRGKPGKKVFDLYSKADAIHRDKGLGATIGIERQRAALNKLINKMPLAGGDAKLTARKFLSEEKKRALEIMPWIWPELARTDVAIGTVPERILTQMIAVPSYLLSAATFVEAMGAHYAGKTAEAEDMLMEVRTSFNRRHFPGHAKLDERVEAYRTSRTFPSSKDIFGFTLRRSSVVEGGGMILPIAGFEKMRISENKGERIYDLGSIYPVCRMDVDHEKTGTVSIWLSQDGRQYERVKRAATTPAISWPVERARFVKLVWQGDSGQPPEEVVLYARKNAAEYSCVKKAGDPWREDAFWRTIPTADIFVLREWEASNWPTYAQAVYDNTTIYVRFVCAFPEGKELRASAKDSSSPVWEDDCVQLFLSPDRESDTFYQVVVNPARKVMTRIHGGKNKTTANVDVLCRTENDRWMCTMAIPVQWFGKTDLSQEKTWGINFCRTQIEPSHLSSWAVLPDAAFWFLQPKNFGTLHFQDSGAATNEAENRE